MILRRTIVSMASIATLVFLLVLATSPSRAQNNGESGSGLQISPTRSDITGSAGEQKNFSMTVRNVTTGDVVAKAILNDFESDNESGTPRIIIDTKERTPYTLDKMLKGLQDIELKAGEVKEVKFTLDIPANVAPGAYFGAIRYQAVPKSSVSGDRQVALNASVAHLVFLDVPGEINEQIQIESLKFQRGGKSGSFFLNAPDKSVLTVKNLGNGFARPFGNVTINYFGKKAYSYDVNNTDPRGTVLPKSSRNFTNDVKDIKKPGKYTAVVGVAYGNGGEVVNYTASFWYIPAWFLILFVALLLAIVGGAYMVYRKKFAKPASKRSRK